MGQQFTSSISTEKFMFSIAALHGATAPSEVFVNQSSLGVLPFLFFLSFLVLGIFGFCFIIYGQGHKLSNKVVRNLAQGMIMLLFVVITGAVSSSIQASTLVLSSGKVLSLLLGGAIGGAVAFIGATISQKVEKLSPLHLTIGGIVCIVISMFGCLTLILVILAGQNWP